MIIPLFDIGLKGKSTQSTVQRHLNLYAEIVPQPDKSALMFYPTPGLNLFSSFGAAPIRGMISAGDFLYVVYRDRLYKVNSIGSATDVGTLLTSEGRVDLAFNGFQVGLVDGQYMYMYSVALNNFNAVAAGLIGAPQTITYQDSYFIATFKNSQQFQISAPYNGLVWDPLDFASSESSPDNLVRGFADHGELVLLGQQTTEFWGNSGGADFPYQVIRGATIEFGLAAPWSLCKFNDTLAGLFANRLGQVQVMIIAGHAPQKISSPELDYLINGYGNVSDATAFAYNLGGHPMYQINFPTAGKSWLYDASTTMWSALEYGFEGERHRAEMQAVFNDATLVADYGNGNIYQLKPDVYTDNGQQIAREIIGKHFFANYRYVAIHRLQVDFETGVGLPSNTTPQVMLQISRDNGRTWGNELWQSIGKIGEYLTRVIWWRLGTARDFVFKLRVTDPVKVVIAGASIEAETRS
jgi:hypothetical protein